MELGLFMMPQHPPTRTLYESWERDLALLQLADQLGYHEAWIGEHITETWENAPVPELLIAQAIKVTRQIILGTGVTLLPLHHPVDVAHRIAMLDHMAQGRFYWGVGVRSIPSDLALYGLDYTQMNGVREQGRECLDVVLGIWAAEDGTFDYDGRYYQVHAPQMHRHLGRRLWIQPYQHPHPPIGVASTSPESDTIRLAGERGWWPLSSSILQAPMLKAQWAKLEAAAAGVGRQGHRREWRIARDIYVAETPQRAREEAREVLGKPWEQHQFNNRQAGGILKYHKRDPAMPDDAVTVDYMLDHGWIVGNPRECAHRLNRLYEEVGGFGTVLTTTHDPDDHGLEQTSLRLLMDEVAPRLKSVGVP
jgi:alkanesulfonate monooxygenase SsuD/methylene tetrahydromethanopterin reductase-like flavin-dependent oxidoreductase (luciferase family)